MSQQRRSAIIRGLRQCLCAAGFVLSLLLTSCASSSNLKTAKITPAKEIRISVADQKMALYENGKPVRVYGVSTSKFGLGDRPASNATPTGKLRVARKIGHGAAPGMVFKSRRPTGEILQPNSPGRDPVVTRILWLQGTEPTNRNAFNRFIYIHGTPEEQLIGRPASYGCVRMRSMDVIDLFNRVPEGTPVRIDPGHLPSAARRQPEYVYTPPAKTTRPLQYNTSPGENKSSSAMVAGGAKPKAKNARKG